MEKVRKVELEQNGKNSKTKPFLALFCRFFSHRGLTFFCRAGTQTLLQGVCVVSVGRVCRVWLLAVVSLWASTSAHAGAGDVWSAEQANAHLELVTEVLGTLTECQDSVLKEVTRELTRASKAIRRGKLSEARTFLARGMLATGVPVSRMKELAEQERLRPFSERQDAVHRGVALAPEHMSVKLRRSILGLKQLLATIETQERKSRDTMAVASPRRNASLARTVSNLEVALDRLHEKLDPTNLQSMAAFILRGSDFILLYSSCLEAILLRHESAELRSEIFRDTIEHYGVKGYFRPDAYRLNEAFEMDRAEDNLRSRLNRQTVMASAFCVALVAEALFYPFGGAGLPATAVALGRTLALIGNASYIIGPAIDIMDRKLGASDIPLWSHRTLTDSLMMVASMPLRLIKVVRGSRYFNLMLTARAVKTSSTYSFFLLRTVDRIGDLVTAEDIAKKRTEKGVPTTAAEVRRETVAALLAYAFWVRGMNGSTSELTKDLAQAARIFR